MTDLDKKWFDALQLLKEDVNEAAFEAWFEPLKPVKLDKKSKKLYIESENNYIVERVNARYLTLIELATAEAMGEQLNVVVSVKEMKPEDYKQKRLDEFANYPMDNELDQENYLNPRFNFNSFMTGPSNELAYSAAKAVADKPGNNQSQILFIYGGSGLGKTHLMHAIGHRILKKFDNKKVLYTSSETFTNELISSISRKTTDEFKKKYRNIDVLLIDDIQFLGNKERTQEEFFYTFEELYSKSKQIVISSDRHPRELLNIDGRLTSRFSWSLVVDIQAPDYETRIAILLNKAQETGVEETQELKDIVNLIANKLTTNVREMEGALTSIINLAGFMGQPISMSLARNVLKDVLSSTDSMITIGSIKREVCKYFNVTLKDMDSKKRSREIAYPRQVAMYLCKDLTENSLPKIGESFGKRDHTTVMHACKKIGGEMTTSAEARDLVEEIKASIIG